MPGEREPARSRCPTDAGPVPWRRGRLWPRRPTTDHGRESNGSPHTRGSATGCGVRRVVSAAVALRSTDLVWCPSTNPIRTPRLCEHDDARCAPMRGVQARLSIRARFLGGENGRTFPTACTAHCVPSDRVGAGLLHLEVVGWLEQRSGVMRVKRACQGVVGKFRQVCVHLQAAAEAEVVPLG